MSFNGGQGAIRSQDGSIAATDLFVTATFVAVGGNPANGTPMYDSFYEKLFVHRYLDSKLQKGPWGPQNGQRGLEMVPTLGYWALPSTFAK